MAVPRFLITAALCAGSAFAIGYLMENGISRASATPVEPPMVEVRTPGLPAHMVAAPQRPSALDRPALARSPARLAALGTGLVGVERPRIPVGDACAPRLLAEPRPEAMISVALSAPCMPDSRVTLHHMGLTVTLMTDTDGRAATVLPALAERAVVIAEPGPGMSVTAMAMVPEANLWHRVALQWQGGEGIGLHALEFGAGYGEAGHVSAAAPDGAQGGGRLMRLGAPEAPMARLAEVYSLPASATGEIDLSVEIKVTAANCGRALAAEVIQVGPGGDLGATDLDVTLPGCEAVGELLVLQSMASDLMLAAR
ncbi:hypothetical protein [Limimaricola pyoseonensis]|uniref:Translocase n=1 Tax=Limimaricola pyoseonensis TaxID=521013 RepID=A0A1G7ES12_9RHOB|nr:hypothetical protein [Limimaricola pyoseonensis]SDE66429.1 hypothetical protein SAMN04488567_2272 [Limimaricola pyoseonensis]